MHLMKGRQGNDFLDYRCEIAKNSNQFEAFT